MGFKTLSKQIQNNSMNLIGGDDLIYFTPDNGITEYKVRGIFDNAYEEIDKGLGEIISTNQPKVEVTLDDFQTYPEINQHIIVNGVWHIINDVMDDGQSGLTIILNEVSE